MEYKNNFFLPDFFTNAFKTFLARGDIFLIKKKMVMKNRKGTVKNFMKKEAFDPNA